MLTSLASNPVFRLVSTHPFAEVWERANSGQKSLHAIRTILPGEVLSDFSAGETLSLPTYLTVQTGTDRHITLQPEFLQYANHSCSRV